MLTHTGHGAQTEAGWNGIGIALGCARSDKEAGTVVLEKVEFAIEQLLDTPHGWRALVRNLVARWPEAPASELVYVLVTAASEIESRFAEGHPERACAARGWRLAALLGVDFYAMDMAGLPRGKAADIACYWTVDPYFRDL